MATRKLRAELELETSRAKQKAREVLETSGGAAGAAGDLSPAAAEAARALKDAAKSSREMGEAARAGGSEMRRMVKMFTGMGIGLATSYAASRLEEGSAAHTAATYGGNIAAGAVAGAAFGPWGAAAGGALAAGKTYLDRDAAARAEAQAKKEQTDANLKSVTVWEETRARTLAFRETLEKLAKSESGLEAELEKRLAADRELAEAQRAAAGDAEKFADATRARQANAAEADALRASLKALEKQGPAEAFRASFSGTDALARVGFLGGGGASFGDLVRTSKEQTAVLKSIERKTGGAAWQ